jgi:hypothetical protein
MGKGVCFKRLIRLMSYMIAVNSYVAEIDTRAALQFVATGWWEGIAGSAAVDGPAGSGCHTPVTGGRGASIVAGLNRLLLLSLHLDRFFLLGLALNRLFFLSLALDRFFLLRLTLNQRTG